MLSITWQTCCTAAGTWLQQCKPGSFLIITITRGSFTDTENSATLEPLIDIAESLPGSEGQVARAYYKLATLCSEMGRKVESEEYRRRAIDLRMKLQPEENPALFDEESFNRLCPWMLW